MYAKWQRPSHPVEMLRLASQGASQSCGQPHFGALQQSNQRLLDLGLATAPTQSRLAWTTSVASFSFSNAGMLSSKMGAKGSNFNLDKCIEQIYRCEILPETTIKQICDKLKETLIYESNIQNISSPITVVGDVHGYATWNLRIILYLSPLNGCPGNFMTC